MKNLQQNDQIGTVVYSKAGRDKNKFFIITGIVDEQYVYISDGSLRLVEKQKKKKKKHLTFTNIVADDIRTILLAGDKVSNSMVKGFLQAHDLYKEV